MRRRKMKKSASKALYKKTANKTHKKNVAATPLRGGWRL